MYSQDLRKRVIGFVENGGQKKATASLFKVSSRTIYSWLTLKRKTKSLARKSYQRNKFKISPSALLKYIEEHPDHYLREIAEQFSTCISAIFYALKKLKITRKKKRYFIANAKKKPERNMKNC